MSKQLELDINRPSWADTDFHSEMKDLWSVRGDSSRNTDSEDHFNRAPHSEYTVAANPVAQPTKSL